MSSGITALKNSLNSGRIVRILLVGGIALVVGLYIARAAGFVGSAKASHVIAPTPIPIPTMEPLPIPTPVPIPTMEPLATLTSITDTVAINRTIYPGEMLVEELKATDFPAWTFYGTQGEIIDLLLMPYLSYERNFNLVGELFSPDGQRIATLNQTGNGQPELLQSLTLPLTGEYTIWVSEEDFDAQGTYALHLLNNFVKNSNPMRTGIGQTVRGNAQDGQYQYWVFSGNPGQKISLSLIPYGGHDDQFSPFLKLFSPDGKLIVEQDTEVVGENLILRDIVLPTSGNYTVWVGEDAFNDRGQFALAIQEHDLKTLEWVNKKGIVRP